ncbi:MAG: hypothetical protein WA191_05870, partial [Telluria sp.]
IRLTIYCNEAAHSYPVRLVVLINILPNGATVFQRKVRQAASVEKANRDEPGFALFAFRTLPSRPH